MIQYIPVDAICLIIKNMTAYEIACLYTSADMNRAFQNRIHSAIEISRIDIIQIYEFIYQLQDEDESKYDDEFYDEDDHPVIWNEVSKELEYPEDNNLVDYYFPDFI